MKLWVAQDVAGMKTAGGSFGDLKEKIKNDNGEYQVFRTDIPTGKDTLVNALNGTWPAFGEKTHEATYVAHDGEVRKRRGSAKEPNAESEAT